MSVWKLFQDGITISLYGQVDLGPPLPTGLEGDGIVSWHRNDLSIIVDECYVDPTFAPSSAAYALYGWVLSPPFVAEAGVPTAATTLPDPRAAAPAPTLPDTPPHVRAARAIALRAVVRHAAARA